MATRNLIQFRRGYSMDATTPINGYTIDSNSQWNCNSILQEGEIGYEIDTGRFKIGRLDNNGDAIGWCDLDYAGGGGQYSVSSGLGYTPNSSGDDTLYSILRNDDNDTNITIDIANLSDIITGASGTYYKLGLANNLTNINNITISGDLSANDANFSGDVIISGNLQVSGTSIEFNAATIVLQTLDVADSGDFGNALTVGGVHVSLSGHQHPYTDITNFCSGVADCVNTQLVGGSGIQLVYSDTDPNNTTLTVALSGSALNLHSLSDSGLIVKKSDGTFVGRSLSSGNNISISNSNGIDGSPTISLVSDVSGLTSLTVDQLKLDGNTISSTDTNGNIILQPDGVGDVYLNADTIRVGDSNANVKITSNGTGDLTLDTNSGTNSSYITIFDGADGDITLQTNGNGEVNINRVDINAGNIDGTTIGSSSAAAATFTSLAVNNSGSISGDLTIGGNLTVNGTSVVANVSTMEVEDPIITLGIASGNIITNDNYDRGLALKFTDRTAFMGYDSDANEFVLLGSGVTTDTGNTYISGVYGDLHIKDLDASNIYGTVITASTKFSGAGTDLTGSGVNFTAGKANNLSNGATGSIPYQSAANSTTFLSIGTSGQFLRVNNGASAPYWDTVDYAELSNLPTIGNGTLTLGVSGSGLSGSGTFDANQTANSTFTVTSNATPANSNNTIVSRDSSGNFSAGTITAGSFVKTLSAGEFSTDLLQAGGGVVSPGSLSVSYAGTAGSANQVANTLTRGSYLTGNNFNGSAATTWAVDADTANTASKIVARDGSGNFSAGTITANLNGTATNADNINVDEKNDNVNYQVLFSAADGASYQRPYIDQDNAQFTYNPSTQTLTVANFAGNASTATSANSATNATNAANVNIAATSSNDNSTYLMLVDSLATGNQSPFIDAGLYYDAGSNALTTDSYYGKYAEIAPSSAGNALSIKDGTTAKFVVTNSGIVTSGTWQGSTIGVSYGGTNITSYAVGDIIYASASTTLSKLAIAGSGNVLLTNNAGTAPTWGKVSLANHITGTLPVSNGGTGATTLTGALIGNGTSAVSGVSSTTPYALFRVNSAGNGYEFSVVIDGGTP